MIEILLVAILVVQLCAHGCPICNGVRKRIRRRVKLLRRG